MAGEGGRIQTVIEAQIVKSTQLGFLKGIRNQANNLGEASVGATSDLKHVDFWERFL